MALLQNTHFLVATLALLTAHIVSVHSLEKRKVTGDKLYVISNRSSCVTVESLDACPVSWPLPPEYAMSYKTQVNALPVLYQVLDLLEAGTKCKETFRKVLCAQIAPKCLPNGGKDFGEALSQCQDIYTSTCPSRVGSAYQNNQYCEQNPTGKHEKAACVAADGYISGACPQPKYKMPADILKLYIKQSALKVQSFQSLENLRDANGNRVLSTHCLEVMKDFSCTMLYCSQDEEELLVEHDYEDCSEARSCYGNLAEAFPDNNLLKSLHQSMNETCRALPRRGTAKLLSPLALDAKSHVGANGQLSKIMLLFVVVSVGFYV